VAGLEAGVIDCVVSDHSPCPPELKSRDSGDFGTAWGGIASLQLGLSAVWTVARRRGRTLDDVVRWMAAAPASLAGLAAKGGSRPGVMPTWWPSTRTRATSWTRPGCSTGIRSRRTRGVH